MFNEQEEAVMVNETPAQLAELNRRRLTDGTFGHKDHSAPEDGLLATGGEPTPAAERNTPEYEFFTSVFGPQSKRHPITALSDRRERDEAAAVKAQAKEGLPVDEPRQLTGAEILASSNELGEQMMEGGLSQKELALLDFQRQRYQKVGLAAMERERAAADAQAAEEAEAERKATGLASKVRRAIFGR